jgi:transcriptional regulator with XRE-family HTH domain
VTAGVPNIESPAVARRRVRLAIREFRGRKKLTQGQVAEAMDWSLSKVQRLEKGEVNISSSDLRLLLAFFGVNDAAETQALIADARLARQERWTTDPADRGYLTPAMIELLQYESEATVIRYFQNYIVPGILQTRAYAEAILRSFPDVDPAVAEARVESRLRRREEILSRRPPPDYLVVLDQSVLYREFGGDPRILIEQLELLERLVGETTVRIRIIRFENPMPGLGLRGSFALHSLAHDESVLLYREFLNTDEIVRTMPIIRDYRAEFERMWAEAADQRASAELIRERIRAGRQRLDAP